MLKKLLATLGIGSTAKRAADPRAVHEPYAEPHLNFLYNLLFCDDPDLFRNHGRVPNDGPWPVLLAEQPDTAALGRIAEDEANEGRVRALAYNRLRSAGEKVAAKQVLGAIVEVPLKQGLDVLAAFSEGGVRYLNQSGKAAIFEGKGNPVEQLAMELVSASQAIVDRIGPWEQSRRPPPKAGDVRMTFLVSDGLYFGEGPFGVMQRDPMAGPFLARAAQLLQRVVELASP